VVDTRARWTTTVTSARPRRRSSPAGAGASNIAKVAAAREFLSLIYYALRGHQSSCLTAPRGLTRLLSG
jgi:hypothetical protein